MPRATSLTSSSVTITWVTTQPATSQVDFGPSFAYGSTSGVDTTLTLEHRQVISGLTPGTVYHFRARSVDALGARVASPDVIFTTPRRGVRGAVDEVVARRVTSTTATIAWTTSTSIAQVEYGQTMSYGSFTLLRVFATANQEATLTGLEPQTLYHYRLKTWDSSGASTTSPDFTFTTASVRQAVLLGNSAIDARRTTIAAGQAFAFQYSAAASGLASTLRIYVDPGSLAPSIGVGIYADEAGEPGALLSQATIDRPIPNGWNTVILPAIHLTQGTSYWIAVLNPVGSGTLAVRGATGGGTSQPALQSSLETLPFTWLTGPGAGTTTLSVAVGQLTPAATLVEPQDGRGVSGAVPMSVTVDDEVPVTAVQFLVDGKPVGPALRTAPYTFNWDSRQASTHEFHALSARVTDSLGRISTSAPVFVHVDNGAAISQVSASAITSSSAWISWSTDTFSDSQVEFGTTTAYGQTAPLDASSTWLHRQQLTGLAPGTAYHYRVKSRDVRGAVGVSADATFRTAP